MITASSIAETRSVITAWKKDSCTICLVPTMGFFHDGHVALMTHGRQRADKVVVSLFVNPTQFGPDEDLDAYPHKLTSDRQTAEAAGVDLLFQPTKAEIYTDDHQTTVRVSELSKGMCGQDRPQHFTGVATIVSKLFNIVEPDMAVFGEKDYQQLAVIKKMVADLNFNVEIIGHEIVREPDGLAMSSRNSYLDKHERREAAILFKVLSMVAQQVKASPAVLESQPLLEAAEMFIVDNSRCSIDYLTIIDSATLEPKTQVIGECRIAGAIRINNKIRLIDNMPLCREFS